MWSRGLPASTRDFPYRALGGEVLKPALPIILHGPINRLALYGLVDSGADYSIFPSDWAKNLGVDLTQCQELLCDTAGGKTQQFLGEDLEIEVQALHVRLAVRGAFQAGLPVGLLGRADFFAVFRVTFDERAQTFRLEQYSGAEN